VALASPALRGDTGNERREIKDHRFPRQSKGGRKNTQEGKNLILRVACIVGRTDPERERFDIMVLCKVVDEMGETSGAVEREDSSRWS